MTRTETRYGCFLSDLTGLARSPSIANLPEASYQLYGAGGQGGIELEAPFHLVRRYCAQLVSRPIRLIQLQDSHLQW